MDPGQTVADQRVLFLEFDATTFLEPGVVNVLGVELGQYMYSAYDTYCNATKLGPRGCLAFIMHLSIKLSDGSKQSIVTESESGRWLARQGPIVFDQLYQGEIYDARIEQHGWNSVPLASMNVGAAAEWSASVAMHPNVSQLTFSTIPPVRVVDSLPATVVKRNVNSTVFGFPRMMSGFCTLTIDASWPANTRVVMRYAELYDDTAGHVMNIYYPRPGSDYAGKKQGLEPCDMRAFYAGGWGFGCSNMSTAYIVAARGQATVRRYYTPSFTYFGFRYVEVFGLPEGTGTPPAELLVAHVVHTDLPRIGSISLPNTRAQGANTSGTPDILNRIHRAAINSQLSNSFSVPTDCPTRERLGFLGDAQFASQGMMYTFDGLSFYESFLRSIRDEQLKTCLSIPVLPCKGPCDCESAESGSVPDAAPMSNQAGPNFPGSVVWQSAYVVIVRHLWRHYGPAALPVLREHYIGLSQFVAYLKTIADNRTGLVMQGGMGEWAPPQPQSNNKNRTTPAAAGSAFYGLLTLKYMAEVAGALGETADAAVYQADFDSGRSAYHEAFFVANKGDESLPPWCFYAGCTQTAHLMPLVIDAVPAEFRSDVQNGLITLIAEGDPSYKAIPNVSGPIPAGHLVVGTIGANFVFDVLTEIGADDLALDLLLTDTYPSYGLMVASDVDAPPRRGTEFPQRGSSSLWEQWEGQSSRNHIMGGGQLQSYFYTSIAGLNTNDTVVSSGWRHVLFRPTHAAVRRLGHAAASIQTPLGAADVSWCLKGRTLTVNTTVPEGATGELSFPLLGVSSRTISISEGGVAVWMHGTFVAGRQGVSAGRVTHSGTKVAVTLTMSFGSRSFIGDVVSMV